jgi:hypothetical protein
MVIVMRKPREEIRAREMQNTTKLPLNDLVIVAVAKMVDDSQSETREPSHNDIEYSFERAGLLDCDPKRSGKAVGKSKRVRAVLSWALENDINAGENLVHLLLSSVKSCGGFRPSSKNYIGDEPIANLREVFRDEGYSLSADGVINRIILENLDSIEMNNVLRAYARRAIKGVDDAALLAGTSKDLMEAVAAFVIEQIWGSYSQHDNFPTLIGQAFTALGLSTSHGGLQQDEPAFKSVERALFELACTINKLRNKEGTGHGRPFQSNVSNAEAKLAIESIGVISEFLLLKLQQNQMR